MVKMSHDDKAAKAEDGRKTRKVTDGVKNNAAHIDKDTMALGPRSRAPLFSEARGKGVKTRCVACWSSVILLPAEDGAEEEEDL